MQVLQIMKDFFYPKLHKDSYFNVIPDDIVHLVVLSLNPYDLKNFLYYNPITLNYEYLIYLKYPEHLKEIHSEFESVNSFEYDIITSTLEVKKRLKLNCELKGLYVSKRVFVHFFRKLRYLPREIGYLPNLKSIDVVGAELTCLPEEIHHLTNLKKLLLSSNSLDRIPIMVSLKKINLSDNIISSIPSDINKLERLKFLNLSDNLLQDIPEELYQLTKLIKLNLSSNNLTSISDGVSNLTRLNYLYLNDNHLSGVCDSITRLTNLHQLDLSRNLLSNLPLGLQYIPGLEMTFDAKILNYQKFLPAQLTHKF